MRRRLSLICLVLFLAAAGCKHETLAISYQKDQIHSAPTRDGWAVGLVHLKPRGEPKPSAPLILCHGFTSTMTTFDLGDGRGLGPFLAQAGYDVWMLNLRGRAYSARPTPGDPRYRYDWTFDDYVHYDVPAALDFVREQTGAEQVTWIGHSMGGMVIYAYLGVYGEFAVDKIVTIGSPVLFGELDDFTKTLVRIGKAQIDSVDGLRVQALARTFAPMLSGMDGVAAHWVINPDNFPRDIAEIYIYNSVPNLSGGILRQFAQWEQDNCFISMDGRIDYRSGLGRIHVPALVIAGKLDHLAATWRVYPGYEALASTDKTFYLLGRVNGCTHEPGHGGIVLGTCAEEDGYPAIQAWLDRRLGT